MNSLSALELTDKYAVFPLQPFVQSFLDTTMTNIYHAEFYVKNSGTEERYFFKKEKVSGRWILEILRDFEYEAEFLKENQNPSLIYGNINFSYGYLSPFKEIVELSRSSDFGIFQIADNRISLVYDDTYELPSDKNKFLFVCKKSFDNPYDVRLDCTARIANGFVTLYLIEATIAGIRKPIFKLNISVEDFCNNLNLSYRILEKYLEAKERLEIKLANATKVIALSNSHSVRISNIGERCYGYVLPGIFSYNSKTLNRKMLQCLVIQN